MVRVRLGVCMCGCIGVRVHANICVCPVRVWACIGVCARVCECKYICACVNVSISARV